MDSLYAHILDGKALAQRIQTQLSEQVAQLLLANGRPPGLAVLMVGDNPASAAYVRIKSVPALRLASRLLGVISQLIPPKKN
jgi:methylenetetrahydrofolate dehydrogenase (NADP+)/methenyltetrahydrofolate cyclohydrolase